MTETCSSLKDDIEALVVAAVFRERARIVRLIRTVSRAKEYGNNDCSIALEILADEIEGKDD